MCRCWYWNGNSNGGSSAPAHIRLMRNCQAWFDQAHEKRWKALHILDCCAKSWHSMFNNTVCTRYVFESHFFPLHLMEMLLKLFHVCNRCPYVFVCYFFSLIRLLLVCLLAVLLFFFQTVLCMHVSDLFLSSMVLFWDQI